MLAGLVIFSATAQEKKDPADLIIMDKNPLENLRNTNTINLVMKNGRLYDGNTLDEVYPTVRRAPSFGHEQIKPEGALPGVNK